MVVDGNVSDLFFNTDVSGAALYEEKHFTGYDHAKMLEEATMFLNCFSRLGVRPLPDTEALVQDFYARV